MKRTVDAVLPTLVTLALFTAAAAPSLITGPM